MEPTFTIKGKLWIWQAEKAAWHFLTVPNKTADQIKGFMKDRPRKGFGSVKVEVTIGSNTWKTSVFPTKEGTYVLPIKKEVRKKEGLMKGKGLTAEIKVLL